MEISRDLINEHGRILRGLEYLSAARHALEKNLHPPKAFFETAVHFFRQYADKFHHYKEEYLMFGFLARKKAGAIDLEMGSLRYQHELNRGCISKIEKSLKGYDMGNEIAVTTLLVSLASFISILRRHIFREDALFFPMAETELSDGEKKALLRQFKQEEETVSGKNAMVRSQTLLEEMAALISEFQRR
jgi:hemerythrin-like domain-containing protein